MGKSETVKCNNLNYNSVGGVSGRIWAEISKLGDKT